MKVWRVEGVPVLEIWESYNGDLYFVTEKEKNGDIFCYARLHSMPEFAEWGYNNINYLKSEYKEVFGFEALWKVKEKNWFAIDSYEKGLLVEDEDPTCEDKKR